MKLRQIRITFYLADFFHGHIAVFGFILGLLAVCLLFAVGR